MSLPFIEADWRLFRKRLPDWQEAYMERLVGAYIAKLTGPGKASEKFWWLEKRIRQDRRNTGVVAEMRRSVMETNIISLLREKVITLDDLEGFSPELRERMARMMSWLYPEDDPDEDGPEQDEPEEDGPDEDESDEDAWSNNIRRIEDLLNQLLEACGADPGGSGEDRSDGVSEEE
ncbi:MAG: hypothetical protein IKS31_11540 [Clostridia bacterium]|nr:hypothetical protein [Clostridia bacterium]